MGLLDMFRRKPPISDSDALARFLDEQAAFLTQKGIYEYARARAGHYAKVLLVEAEFLAAVERARWQAYPLGLMMVAEMAEGVLRPQLGDIHERLVAAACSAFDRYPAPDALGTSRWREIRDELAQNLERLGRYVVKPVKDIPEPYAEAYFALMPIHEKLRGRDFPTMRNYLRIALCNIHDELIQRIDAPALAADFGSESRAVAGQRT
jgi:hypothetical protein